MNGFLARFTTTDGWHRVHWFRLVELLARAALASLILLSTGVPNSIGAWVEESFGLVMGLLAITNFLSTRYKITASSVTTTQGVLFRSEETMRRADVQTVQVLHPVWYRPLNLARVTIADDAGNELAVGPVTRAVADYFAVALDSATTPATDVPGVSRRPSTGHGTGTDVGRSEPEPSPAPDTETSPGEGEAAEPITARVDLPLWKRFVVSIGDLGLVITLIAIVATGYFGSWVVATLIAVAAVWVPIFEVVSLGRFRLVVSDDEILVRDGIITVSESRTTRQRSEFLRVDTPLIYRLLRLERVVLGNGDDLLVVAPAQPHGEWRRFAPLLLGIIPPDESVITLISSRSVGRFRIIGSGIAVTIGVVVSAVGWRVAIPAAVIAGLLMVGWYPQARLARFGIGSTDSAVMTKASFAPRRMWLHRLDRIDASTLTHTPGQRRRRLATLRFSGRSASSEVRVPDLDAALAARCEHLITSRLPGDLERVPGRRIPAAITSERCEAPFPAAAGTVAALSRLPWAALTVAGWSGLMAGVRLFDAPDSAWRSQWLLWGGTIFVVVAAVWMLAIVPWRVRREHWSLTNRIVEHRRGVVVTSRTTVKRSYVSAAKFNQGPVQRWFGLGSLTLLTRGLGNPDLVLPYLDADEARELADMHRSANGR